MAASGIDASVELSTRPADGSIATAAGGDAAGGEVAAINTPAADDDDALLARMLGAPLSHDDGDDGGGGFAGALSISVDAPVGLAAEEEEWIE